MGERQNMEKIMENTTEPIYIQKLGGFRISSGNAWVEESAKKAPKLWKLLQYLIIFRHRPISKEELISAIWADDDQTDPGNAMRNLIFRIRSMLAKSGISQRLEMLTSKSGSYCWNNELVCVVDCEELERLHNLSRAKDIARQEKLEKLFEAMDLYKGDFLPNANFDLWAVPLKVYYRALYLKCAYSALEMLEEEGRFSEAEMICKRVLLIDQFDEKLHEYHLKALVGQGKQAAAIDEYQKMTDMFFDELGISPSEKMTALYASAIKAGKNDAQSLKELTQDWIGTADSPGAYLCEYGMFKTAYQIEARSITRSGRAVYVVSFTIDSVQESNEKNAGAMRHLGEIIQNSFRKGDLFTRSTRSQYMVILYNLTYEDCVKLSKRVYQKHKQKNRSLALKIEIQPMLPADSPKDKR